MSVVGVVYCQMEVSTECDSEASIMRRPWLTVGCCCITKMIIGTFFIIFGIFHYAAPPNKKS
jgi:hypothetical protein